MSTQPQTTMAKANPQISTSSQNNTLQSRHQKKVALASTITPMLSKAANQNTQQKKIPRRSSKPIINWFQRKLAGSGKAKRSDNAPLVADLGLVHSSPSGRHMGRITSSPLPAQLPLSHRQNGRLDGSLIRRKTRSISLNGDEELREFRRSYDDDTSMDQSSLQRESIWSPASALEADDDASVRPIPPSAPPSPSPSRSSSSVLSDPRTFRSMTASTKPTTVLSIDLNGNGMAHIAQVPTQTPAQIHRFVPHVRQSSSLSTTGMLSSGNSITFSALPTSSRPSSLRHPGSLGSISLTAQQPSVANNGLVAPVQAPLHTNHHPRNNPRPSSPPLDNASMLTLASSAFAHPMRLGPQNYPPSALGDAASHYGGSVVFPDGESTSHYILGDDERLEERDFDASVRALRPRSSRRGSWESEASRWSARVQGTGTPSVARNGSLWASNSIKTGGLSTENEEVYETADDEDEDEPLEVNIDVSSDNEDSNADTSISVDSTAAAMEECQLSTPDDDISLNTNNPSPIPPPVTTLGPATKNLTSNPLTRTSVDTVARPSFDGSQVISDQLPKDSDSVKKSVKSLTA
ncbi:hypothetical protein CVT24_003874 [Panaeolus cyanescens]|uniref:Uncharacterized protein n=1 Tax=Panaeolus cyanescens TaxID=181874 RepID=A0A409VV53_9AGAR|nr:hypothetical protein CVT24_003874 [Panaeolus cyanescens]